MYVSSSELYILYGRSAVPLPTRPASLAPGPLLAHDSMPSARIYVMPLRRTLTVTSLEQLVPSLAMIFTVRLCVVDVFMFASAGTTR